MSTRKISLFPVLVYSERKFYVVDRAITLVVVAERSLAVIHPTGDSGGGRVYLVQEELVGLDAWSVASHHGLTFRDCDTHFLHLLNHAEAHDDVVKHPVLVPDSEAVSALHNEQGFLFLVGFLDFIKGELQPLLRHGGTVDQQLIKDNMLFVLRGVRGLCEESVFPLLQRLISLVGIHSLFESHFLRSLIARLVIVL